MSSKGNKCHYLEWKASQSLYTLGYLFYVLIFIVCAMLLSICSEDEEELTSSSMRHRLVNGSCQPFCAAQARGQGHLQRIISIEEDHLPSFLIDCQVQTPLQECNEGKKVSDNEDNIDLVMSDIHARMSSASHQQSMEKMETPSSPRGQPVGKENSMNVSFVTLL